MPSSNAFLNCRIDWRPAPLMVAALALLGFLAALSLLASAMPRPAAWPLALLLLGQGLWLAWRESQRPAAVVVFTATDEGLAPTLDGRPARLLRVNLRGPVAVMVLQCDSRRRVLTWCPPTLTPDVRRTLRLLKRPGIVSPSALPLVAG